MSTIEKDLNPDTYIGLTLPISFGSEGDFNRTKKTIKQTDLLSVSMHQMLSKDLELFLFVLEIIR